MSHPNTCHWCQELILDSEVANKATRQHEATNYPFHGDCLDEAEEEARHEKMLDAEFAIDCGEWSAKAKAGIDSAMR